MDVLSSLPLLAWGTRALPILIGGAVGFAYHKIIGCRSGVCPITNNPWMSTIYGAIMGSMWAH